MATATVTKLQNFINGEFVDPAEGATEEVVNPATGERFAEAPLSTAEDVDRAVRAGRASGEYLEGYTSIIRREPVGVVGQITPWNYPLMMAIWKISPALAAGNTVVLKPAETTPETTVMLAELAAEFLPAGVLNVACGDRDSGRALVAHPVPGLVSI